jgi:hypothetical protein
MKITKAHAQRMIALLDSRGSIEVTFIPVLGSDQKEAEAQLLDIILDLLCTTFGEEAARLQNWRLR